METSFDIIVFDLGASLDSPNIIGMNKNFGAAGKTEVREVSLLNHDMVQLDVNGDGKVVIAIDVYGTGAVMAWTEANFAWDNM